MVGSRRPEPSRRSPCCSSWPTDLRMNSSTSISDPSHWGRLLRRYVASTLIVGAAVVGLLLALDPYDTGRYSLLPAHGVASFGQRLAFASVARRPDVDAAIIG